MAKKKIKTTSAEIDEEILALFQQENTKKIINDQKLFNRAILNAFAELLAEFKKLNECQENLLTTVSMLSSEKLQEFFYEVKKNYNEAVKEEKNNVTVITDKK